MIDRRNFVRPSSLPALENCPGRALCEARAVDLCPELMRVEHPAAQQGTIGHAIVAQTLSLIYHGPDGWQNPAVVLAKMENALSALEPWAADAARRCVNYSVALVDREAKAKWNVTIHVEMHLSGAHIGLAKGGTADVVIVCTDKAGKVGRVVVSDQKLGFLDQGNADEHLQLWAYAVMAGAKYDPYEGVEINLAQGRRRSFSAAYFDKTALAGAADRCRSVAMAANGADPECHPAIDACRYCKALPLCRAVREEIMKATDAAALFGIDDTNRVKLAEIAAIAGRFAEEVKLLQKEWVKTAQAEPPAKEPDPSKGDLFPSDPTPAVEADAQGAVTVPESALPGPATTKSETLWYVCVKCHAIEESDSALTRCRHCPEGRDGPSMVRCSSLAMARKATGVKA